MVFLVCFEVCFAFGGPTAEAIAELSRIGDRLRCVWSRKIYSNPVLPPAEDLLPSNFNPLGSDGGFTWARTERGQRCTYPFCGGIILSLLMQKSLRRYFFYSSQLFRLNFSIACEGTRSSQVMTEMSSTHTIQVRESFFWLVVHGQRTPVLCIRVSVVSEFHQFFCSFFLLCVCTPSPRNSYFLICMTGSH